METTNMSQTNHKQPQTNYRQVTKRNTMKRIHENYTNINNAYTHNLHNTCTNITQTWNNKYTNMRINTQQ